MPGIRPEGSISIPNFKLRANFCAFDRGSFGPLPERATWVDSFIFDEFDWSSYIIAGDNQQWKVQPFTLTRQPEQIPNEHAPEDFKFLQLPIAYHIGSWRKLVGQNPLKRLVIPVSGFTAEDQFWAAENTQVFGTNELPQFADLIPTYAYFPSYYLPKHYLFTPSNLIRPPRTIMIHINSAFDGSRRTQSQYNYIIDSVKERLDIHNIFLCFNRGFFDQTAIFSNLSEHSSYVFNKPFLFRKYQIIEEYPDESPQTLSFLISTDNCYIGNDLLYIAEYGTGANNTDYVITNFFTGVPLIAGAGVRNTIDVIEYHSKRFNKLDMFAVVPEQEDQEAKNLVLNAVLGELADYITAVSCTNDKSSIEDTIIEIINNWIDENYGEDD